MDEANEIPPENRLRSGCSADLAKRRRGYVAPWIFVLPGLLLITLYILLRRYYLNFFPYGDDPAVLTFYGNNFSEWFTRGTSDLLIAYPEWTTPFTDFMRPGSGLVIYLDKLLFGQHYALYFAGYYALQFAGVALAILIGRQHNLPSRWLVCLGLVLAINPSFAIADAIGSQMDLWTGVYSLLAFYLVSRGRYFLALIPLTAGVFTKETAIIASICACLTTYIATKRWALSLSLLSPVLFFAAVRRLVFRGSVAGMYAIPRQPREMFLLVTKGILQWPTGILGHEGAKKIIESHSISGHEADAAILIVNALLWLVLLAVAFSLAAPGGERSPFTLERSSIIPLAIWTFGALGFGILGPKPSYGVSIYPFEILLFAVICHHAKGNRLRTATAAALAMLGIAFVWQFQSSVRSIDWDSYYSMKQLVAALKNNDGAEKTIYVLNSAQSYSSPSYIARFAGIRARLVVLNEFEGCVHSADGETMIRLGENRALAESRIPACADITISSVHTPKLIGALKGSLQRGSFATYSFPQGRIASIAVRSGEPIIDFGRKVHIDLTPETKENFVVLYYDWSLGGFACAGSGCSDNR